MEYTVQKLGKLAGISTRTLRYYDEIGLLKPARINSSGYRIYGQSEVDLLQQIMFYRELGVGLENIRDIMTADSFDEIKALQEHYSKLLAQKERISALIGNVEKTIKMKGGMIEISNKEKFEGFKQGLIDENEKRYGKEIREKYGDKQVEASNEKLKNITPEQFQAAEKLNEQLFETLKAAIETKNPSGELAQKAAQIHREWLSCYWPEYSKEAHAGVAKMYVDDERFAAYYDKIALGTAEFLRDAVLIYTGMTQ